MNKYITLGLLVLSAIIPISTHAQTAYISNTTSSVYFNSNSCIAIQNNLSYRMRDINTNGEVSTLQDFLQSKGYLNSEPTGYYGLLTTAAVSNYQRANGLSPDGSVGGNTRIRIQTETCGGSTASLYYPGATNVGCKGEAIFSTTTGERCATGGYGSLIVGCYSSTVFSPVTGQPCNGSSSFPYGCYSSQGWSTTTGQPCGNNYPTYSAPVISFITNPGGMGMFPGGKVLVYGSNFDSATYVILDGVYGGQSINPDTNSITPTSFTFTLPLNISLGMHNIQIAAKAAVFTNSPSFPFTVTANTGCSRGLQFDFITGAPCVNNPNSLSPIINFLSANSSSIAVGSSTTLSLSASNSTSCSVSGFTSRPTVSSNGSVVTLATGYQVQFFSNNSSTYIDGNITVSPSNSTIYTATCFNAYNHNDASTAKSITVYVYAY